MTQHNSIFLMFSLKNTCDADCGNGSYHLPLIDGAIVLLRQLLLLPRSTCQLESSNAEIKETCQITITIKTKNRRGKTLIIFQTFILICLNLKGKKIFLSILLSKPNTADVLQIPLALLWIGFSFFLSQLH